MAPCSATEKSCCLQWSSTILRLISSLFSVESNFPLVESNLFSRETPSLEEADSPMHLGLGGNRLYNISKMTLVTGKRCEGI